MVTRTNSTRRHKRTLVPVQSYGEFGSGRDSAAERAHFLRVLERVIREAIENNSSLLTHTDFFLRYIRSNVTSLAIQIPAEIEELNDVEDMTRPQRREILRKLLPALSSPEVIPPSSLDVRVEYLVNAMGLSYLDGAVMGLLHRCSVYDIWQRLIDNIGDGKSLIHVRAVGLMLGYTENQAYEAFGDEAPLIVKGLAERDSCRSGVSLRCFDFVTDFLSSQATTPEEMLAQLMPTCPVSTLDTVSYVHMCDHLRRAQRLVVHALESGERANILLFGAPGTGKTEFARLIAGEAGAAALSIGQADEDGDEPSRSDRTGHLRVCRKLAVEMGNVVFVIDEAEDLFISTVGSSRSKLWLNRLVEEGSGPHIWIVNNPKLLGEPVVRRMDMAIHFDMPPAAARRTIIERLIAREAHDIACDEGDGKRLVTELAALETSPAILHTAMRTATRVGETADGVICLARDLAEASGREPAVPGRENEVTFDPALSVADYDLVRLADKLATSPANWSLLLSGPPGTGKSAFARHLAKRMGCDLICRSGAELLGMFVGETEQQIASAFFQAERKKAILLIDEADSFLADRNRAHRNWEVSMVNEMLRQMEQGRVRFIATTNRAATLDPATARRFTLHAEFTALDTERARQVFQASFGQDAPCEFDRISGLTPGDFAQVNQRARLLGETEPVELTRWLADIVEKRGPATAPIGFRLP